MGTKQQPFLRSIASVYAEKEHCRLPEFCFIFPNKRSATFFIDFLADELRSRGVIGFLPECQTIVDFVESFSDGIPADRMEMIFILFDVYLQTIQKRNGKGQAESIDFNKFIYWADVLLNDFDDVDISLADPAMLFRNVETLKEISANYLTAEQIDVIRHYWSDDKIPQDVQNFWNHIVHSASGTDSESALSTGFLKLWQVLKDVYIEFQAKLDSMGLHTAGMAYRQAVEKLRNIDSLELPFKRYVFVGFNNLSKSEHEIMTILKRQKDAETGESYGDFYWDMASPVFSEETFAFSRQIKQYAKAFPPKYDCISPIGNFPEIQVLGIPSRVGQSKVIGRILDKIFAGSEQIDECHLKNTAVILPEENMLLPLLTSIPRHISPLNITMGYRLKNTSVAGLIRDIASMQMRAYKTKAANGFFRDDVRNVLSHPLVNSCCPADCARILSEIQQRRYINVPEELFSRPENSFLKPIFHMIANKTEIEDVFSYISGLLKWISGTLLSNYLSGFSNWFTNMAEIWVTSSQPIGRIDRPSDYPGIEDDDGKIYVDNTASTTRNVALQNAFLRRYASAIEKLKRLCKIYINTTTTHIKGSSIFHLAERILQGEMLNFDGVPLRGLQTMGVLEARSLDFGTLIIPSMNERVFPRAKFTGSFIPTVLRNAYGLPSPEDQENAYAYYFYRMISRAEKVFLIYDARSTGLKSRQMSRYIHQLLHLFKPSGMTHRILPYRMAAPEPPEFSVIKSPDVMSRLNRYRSDTNPLYLSASSIKLYIGCPMAFYFEKIMGYRREDEVTDWIDESTYGTIVHEVFEHLYKSQFKDNSDSGTMITAEILDNMRKNIAGIDMEITKAINDHYHRLGENCTTELSGDSKLIGLIIRDIVIAMLEREKAMTPFVYLHGEWEGKQPLLIEGATGKRISINFNCRIDRVDNYLGDGSFPRLRIIDYKTGGDRIDAPGIDQVFSNYDQKAFLQLMLYCEAYAQFTGYTDVIQPMVYQVRKAMVSDIEPLKLWPPEAGESVVHLEEKMPAKKNGKWKLLDYRDYKTEFNDKLIEYLEELFNENVPFRCTNETDTCKLCAFKAICQRETK